MKQTRKPAKQSPSSCLIIASPDLVHTLDFQLHSLFLFYLTADMLQGSGWGEHATERNSVY